MNSLLILCFVLLWTSCVEGDSVIPWIYFNGPRDLSGLQDFNSYTNTDSKIVQVSQKYFPEFSQSFTSTDEKLTWPRIETGFVPSFGNLANINSAQSSSIFENPHSNKGNVFYKQATNQVPVFDGRYSQTNKGYPVNGKHRAAIYKPAFNVVSHLSQLRDDPGYQKTRSNVNTNAKRLKKKEKYPSGVSGGVHERQQNEYYEPQYEKHVTQKKPNCKTKPLTHSINYHKIQQKNRYPLPNHANVKIHPSAYNPLKSHISHLKNNQQKTFSEGNNEYPEHKLEEVQANEEEVLSGGRDILDNQKVLFENKKENFNRDFSRHIHQYHPISHSQLESSHKFEDDGEEKASNTETDFIPIKSYAQVRHTETVKHLPREAAYEDAETFDEVLNAPRLREAIKTSKAQTVYTEEGYEDAAYDHAGHLKHASNHEGYAGYLKGKHDGENENEEEDKNRQNYHGKSKRGHNNRRPINENSHEALTDTSHFEKEDDNSEILDLTGAGSAKLSSNNVKNNTSEENTKLERKTADKIFNNKSKVEIIQMNNNRKKESTNKDSLVKTLKVTKKPVIIKQKLQVPIDDNIEVFDAGFNFNSGPKHGGNYHVHPTLYNYPKQNEKLELVEKSSMKNNDEHFDKVNYNGHAKNINKQDKNEIKINIEGNNSLTRKLNDTYNSERNEPLEDFDEVEKRDQYPNTSQVEVFRADFMSKNGPKHGGNYRKRNPFKRKSNLYSELEDLEKPGESLHGGNYKTQMETTDSQQKDILDKEEGSVAASENEGLPMSIINNIAFLTSNMTVPSTAKPTEDIYFN